MASVAGAPPEDLEGLGPIPPEALPPSDEELVESDGVPIDSPWHRAAIHLLIESLTEHWDQRDDFYVGGDMFIYFSTEQARNREFRGPDFYVVLDVPRRPARRWWAAWNEAGRLTDFVLELTSPST